MMLLLATLFGDVASLRYSTPVDNEEEGALDERAGGPTHGVGYVLSRSFGKFVEVRRSMDPGSKALPARVSGSMASVITTRV